MKNISKQYEEHGTDPENSYFIIFYYTGYETEKGEVVKLTENVGEEGYGTATNFYFKNGELFFIYQVDGCYRVRKMKIVFISITAKLLMR